MEKTNVNQNKNNKKECKKENNKKQKIKKQKCTKLNNKIDNEDPLLKSIKLNYIFYTTCIISLYIISIYSNRNFLFTCFTFLIASIYGYASHFTSHSIHTEELYLKQDNYFTRNNYLRQIILYFCKILDFHDKTHHDSNINKTPINLFYEFLLNLLTQGGLMMLVVYFAKQMNGYIFLMWGLLYCTIHIINYNLMNPEVHVKHHKNKFTNYGIDVWDIILGTKYEDNLHDIELINHYSINVVIVTFIIIMLIKYKIFNFLL